MTSEHIDSWTEEDYEALRKTIQNIVESMLNDGCSKVYTPENDFWQMKFEVKREANDISLTYLDYGQWYPVPEKYRIKSKIFTLLELVKNRKKGSYEISVSPGIVSVDNDKELVIICPKTKEEFNLK